jgi:hypothetical protein
MTMNARWLDRLWMALSSAALVACQTAPEPPAEAPAAPVVAEEPAPVAPPIVEPAPVDPVAERIKALAQALEAYTDGRYPEAIAQLSPLATATELLLSERVRVFKTMAFSHCALMQLRACRDSFEQALLLDPTFQLTEAERGHPVWGREFRSARAASRKRTP